MATQPQRSGLEATLSFFRTVKRESFHSSEQRSFHSSESRGRSNHTDEPVTKLPLKISFKKKSQDKKRKRAQSGGEVDHTTGRCPGSNPKGSQFKQFQEEEHYDASTSKYNLVTVEGQLKANPNLSKAEAKVEAKREYHRAHAAQCRSRNKDLVNDLKTKVAEVTQLNQQLQAKNEMFVTENALLRAENSALKSQKSLYLDSTSKPDELLVRVGGETTPAKGVSRPTDESSLSGHRRVQEEQALSALHSAFGLRQVASLPCTLEFLQTATPSLLFRQPIGLTSQEFRDLETTSRLKLMTDAILRGHTPAIRQLEPPQVEGDSLQQLRRLLLLPQMQTALHSRNHGCHQL